MSPVPLLHVKDGLFLGDDSLEREPLSVFPQKVVPARAVPDPPVRRRRSCDLGLEGGDAEVGHVNG